MNTRPPSQHETLNDEERELARVVRALPGGEPPSALDALILKAATDAVASSASPKKLPWTKSLLGSSVLWLGTAAASILTVGVGWQLFQSMRAPIYELPADENVSSAQETDAFHKDESMIVEVVPAREPVPTSPPPPEAFADAEQADDATASMAAAEESKAMDADVRKQEARERQAMSKADVAKAANDETDKRRNQAVASDLLGETAAAAAPAPPPPPPAMAAAPMAPLVADSPNKEVDAVIVTGSKIRRAVEAESAPSAQASSRSGYSAKTRASIDADTKLPPALWLDAIKERVARNDIEGAEASMKLFKEAHPKLRIPEELKFLLQ